MFYRGRGSETFRTSNFSETLRTLMYRMSILRRIETVYNDIFDCATSLAIQWCTGSCHRISDKIIRSPRSLYHFTLSWVIDKPRMCALAKMIVTKTFLFCEVVWLFRKKIEVLYTNRKIIVTIWLTRKEFMFLASRGWKNRVICRKIGIMSVRSGIDFNDTAFSSKNTHFQDAF